MHVDHALAIHMTGKGHTVEELTDLLDAAESGDVEARAAAMDIGITVEELCSALRMAIEMVSRRSEV